MGSASPDNNKVSENQENSGANKEIDPKELIKKRPGGDEPEVITGTSGDDLIDGFGGNDTITGLGGDDILIGGDGDDVIDGGTGTNRLYGDAGDDTITSSGTDDFVDAGEGNNNITLSSNAQAGIYQSGAGDDIYNLQDGYRSRINSNNKLSLNTGAGSDTVNVNTSLEESRFDLEDGNDIFNWNKKSSSNWITVTAGGGNDIINIKDGSSGYFSIYGHDGNDTFNLTGNKLFSRSVS